VAHFTEAVTKDVQKETAPIINQKEVLVKIVSNSSAVEIGEAPLPDPPKVENSANNSVLNEKGTGWKNHYKLEILSSYSYSSFQIFYSK